MNDKRAGISASCVIASAILLCIYFAHIVQMLK
ncbi:hypothetical protein L610_001700000130 [Aminobacter sp. J44]|nr:hypothetical protein L610_001700000130 [Aminobacter sp. J44]